MLCNRLGKVLWFKFSRGYIRDNESDEDFPFHWTDILTADETGYFILYSGDNVEFDIIHEAKLKATRIKRLPAISTNGKPLIRIAYIKTEKNLKISKLETKLTSKAQFGLRFLNVYKDKVFASSEIIHENNLEEIWNLSNESTGFCEGSSFDIIFI